LWRITHAVPHHVTDGRRGEVSVGERHRDDRAEEDPDPEVEAPRPRPAAVDDVLLAEAVVGCAEEAGPWDQPPDDQIDEAAEADHGAGGGRDRPADAQPDLVVEPHVGRRARQQRDEGRDAGEPPQLAREGERFVARPQTPHYVGGRHVLSVAMLFVPIIPWIEFSESS
jgi:hypothetical protein